MALDVHIDVDTRLVLVVATGRVDDADLLATVDDIRADPRFADGFKQLYDLSGVTDFAVTPDALRVLTTRPPKHRDLRRAVIAPADLAFGIARMYMAYSEQRDGAAAVFRDRQSAEAWLDGDD